PVVQARVHLSHLRGGGGRPCTHRRLPLPGRDPRAPGIGDAGDDRGGGRALAFVDSLPAGTTSSMQRDVMAGRPSELEAQCGAVVRLGREAGVLTPVNVFLYSVLVPQERAARQ